MKICFYNLTAGYKSGGLETYCWEVGKCLTDRGHHVTIFGGIGGKPRYENIEFKEFKFIPREKFPNFGTRSRKLAERITFGINSWRYLLNENYDVIIINKPFDMPILSIIRKFGSKSITVFRSGGTDFFFGDKFFKKNVDIWISCSRYNAEQIKKRYNMEVEIIHNGVDINKFRPYKKIDKFKIDNGIPLKNKIVMSVGRVIGLKGLETIVNIMNSIPNFDFVIIGKGPALENLRKRAQMINVSDRVHFLGEISHNKLPEILSQADIFVQPSIGEEAFGITIVEAMACELPVCASNIGGIPEIVKNNETGLLLPPGNINSWKKAIQFLIEREDIRQIMGIKGRERVTKNFTWSANAEKLEKIIDNYIKNNRNY